MVGSGAGTPGIIGISGSTGFSSGIGSGIGSSSSGTG